MEIRWSLLYVVINCAYCVAKPVSLNEVIAAESQQKQLVHAASPKLEEPIAGRVSLNKGLKPLLRAPKKFKEAEIFFPLGKKTSSLKYRKTFQIKSPLRPKRIKHRLLLRYKPKNQSVKREISGNEKLNKKYIPLLRSLGMLFDNLLAAESSESAELTTKRKRVRYYTDTSEILCPCSSKSNTENQSDETATSTETFSDETSSPAEVAPSTSDTTTASNLRRLRENKNIPLLLPRNTSSGRRDDNGFGERSRAAHHGSAEGNISRDHGDSELSTGDGSHESSAADYEEDTGDDSRYDASRARSHRRVPDRYTADIARNHTEIESEGETTINGKRLAENEAQLSLVLSRGNLDKPKREDKQQIRNIEAESAELLSAPIGRLRGILPADKVEIPKSKLESEETNVEQDHSVDQQLADGSSAIAEENKETSTGYQTVELHNIPTMRPDSSKPNPVVFIIDGYSVTRNKNGENKIKEKAIHIHSK